MSENSSSQGMEAEAAAATGDEAKPTEKPAVTQEATVDKETSDVPDGKEEEISDVSDAEKDEEKPDVPDGQKDEEKSDMPETKDGDEASAVPEAHPDDKRKAEKDEEKSGVAKFEDKSDIKEEKNDVEESDISKEHDVKADEVKPGAQETKKREWQSDVPSEQKAEKPEEMPDDDARKAASEPAASREQPKQAALPPKQDTSARKPGSPRSEDESEGSNSHNRPAKRGFRILGVEFAPLNTPMRRRLQTLAVAQWLLSLTVLPVLCVLFMLMLMITPLAPLVLAYIGWVLVFDRGTSQRGGRRWERIRRWSLWRHYRDYFPISLVKSAELDPAHNYLIGYHPHGIISCGAFCNFGTEATGFSAKFPGIRPYLLTLRVNFFWPLLRGYYLAAGLCDVSRPSIQWILGREGGGNAAIIVVGGAQEALDARPSMYRLTLLRRKGFARMALQTGAHLVPCFSFGENDLFRQASNPPGSRVRAFQQLFKGALGSSPPFFYGRGVFNYNFGLLPFRHEVITVVGAPIPVVKCPEPSAEQIDRLHEAYMAQLADLFDQHKGRYGVSDDVRLEFV